jgi:glutamine phosphoribosylpyrophosphate amidotransferase
MRADLNPNPGPQQRQETLSCVASSAPSAPATSFPHPDRRAEAPRIPRLRLCGVAVHQGGLRRARSTERVAELQSQRVGRPHRRGTGIAHTRWATHGAPAVHNAHPHFSPGRRPWTGPWSGAADGVAAVGRVALVHNGIIENHDELRAELRRKGYVFTSQTDTEVLAHLIDHLYQGDLLDAVQRTVPRCAVPTPSRCSAATSRVA